MSSRRSLWSEHNARRAEVFAITLAIGFVLMMAVAVVLVSHAWTAGPVTG